MSASPAVTVRMGLEAARRAGVPFGAAWPAVLDSIEDARWREALAQTSNTWRRAYALEPPTAADLAVDLLSRGIAGELADLDADARCPMCDARVPQPPRGQPKVFCGDRCRKVWQARRELLAVAA